MEFIIIIIIIAIVVHFVKKRKPKEPAVFSKGDPSQMPNDLAELRKLRDKAKSEELAYQYSRKICMVGVQLCRENKVVWDPSSEYDIFKLLGEMKQFIDDCNNYANRAAEPKLEFACLQAGAATCERIQPKAEKEVAAFLQYAWENLPDFYAEGKVCPRNPVQARKYYRMFITYQARMENMSTRPIEKLMEIPDAGESGKTEILKYIALMYGIDALRIKKKLSVRNCFAQTLQQAAELLFQMDWGRIGSADTAEMIDEYKKGVAAGNAYAQYKLGQFYLEGRFVEKNEEQGLALLEKAAEQSLYLAVDKISNHYYWLAHPYAGDYGDATKAQIKEWTAKSNKWSAQSDRVLYSVEHQYANSFGEYLPSTVGMSTRGGGQIVDVEAMEKEFNADNSFAEPTQEQKDMESPFTILDLPDVITGPYEVTYRKQSVSMHSAEYLSDHGATAVIHVSDIGMSGTSAKNSYGYFHWL